VDGRDATGSQEKRDVRVTTYLGVVVRSRLVEDVKRRRIVEQHVNDAQRALAVGRHGGHVRVSTGKDVAGKPKCSIKSAVAARTAHFA